MFKIKDEVKLIAIDMDGTLLNENHELSPYTKSVIKRAQEKGIHIVLSTGRPLVLCYDYHQDLALKTDIVTANGAQIWTPNKKILAEYTFDSSIAEELWHYGNLNNHYMWMVATNEMFRNSSRPSLFQNYDWIKLGFGRLSAEEKSIIWEKLIKISDLEITSSSRYNVEVNPKNVNKANGLKIVTERLGIRFDNVIAIGDSLNDKTMLEAAQIGVAMDNAIPEIKELADVITDSNQNDGVAKVINHVIKEQDKL